METAIWLLSAPEFWWGVVICATVVLVALLPAVLFPHRRIVEVYHLHDRAPVPLQDPFLRPDSGLHNSSSSTGALKEHRYTPGKYHAGNRRPPSRAVTEGRKRAHWHPHPDDDFLS